MHSTVKTVPMIELQHTLAHQKVGHMLRGVVHMYVWRPVFFSFSEQFKTKSPAIFGLCCASLGSRHRAEPQRGSHFVLTFLKAPQERCWGGLLRLLVHKICLEISFFDSTLSLPPGSEVCLSHTFMTVQHRKALNLPFGSKILLLAFFFSKVIIFFFQVSHFYIRNSFHVCIIWKIYNEPTGKRGH